MKSSKTNATIHYKLVTFKVYVPLKFPRGVNRPFSESQIHHIGIYWVYIRLHPHSIPESGRCKSTFFLAFIPLNYQLSSVQHVDWILVGGLEPWNFMTFHILGMSKYIGNVKIPTEKVKIPTDNVKIPTDFHSMIFQRGRYTTPNQSQPASWRGMIPVWASFFSMKSHGKFMKVHRKKTHLFYPILSSRLAKKTKVTTDCAQMIFLVRSERVATWRHAGNHLVSWVFWIWWVVWKSCNVAKTIRTNPSHHHFYRWYVYHSQIGWFMMVLPTWSLNPMVNQISV